MDNFLIGTFLVCT